MTKDPFTHVIIGKAMETHSTLGPGLVEEFYHRDLLRRLVAAGIEHLSKPRRELRYRGHVADIFEPDLVFPGKLIPELKALRGEFPPSHFTQLLGYLKCWEIPTGMLFDFGKAGLLFERVAFTPCTAEFPVVELPPTLPRRDLAERLIVLLRQIGADIGPGYREQTWQGIVRAALLAEGLPHVVSPAVRIGVHGQAELRCILVDDFCPLVITALADGVSAADRAVVQTCLRWLDLPWGIAVHFGRRSFDVRIVTRASFPQIRDSADNKP